MDLHERCRAKRQGEVHPTTQPTAPEEQPLVFTRREGATRFTATATAQDPARTFFYVAKTASGNVAVDINSGTTGIKLWITSNQARALAQELLQAASFLTQERNHD